MSSFVKQVSTVCPPDREVHHVVDLVPPDEAPEGEAFELDDQDVGQTPQQQLLGGLAVLLALWAVPETHSFDTQHCYRSAHC